MDTESIREAILRKAIRMQIGGGRPPDDPMASWFGRVNGCLPDEDWPATQGQAMHALCQLNLTELPFRPPGLEDLQFITVFIGPEKLPVETPNGDGWALRAYTDVSALVPLSPRDTGSHVKSLPMFPELLEADFPCWEDVPTELRDHVDHENFHEMFENQDGFKLGGWPTLVQSEIYWAPWNKHPIKPRFVFQIDTTAKGQWTWGDRGIGYFGRSTAQGHENEWTLAWQSM